MRRYVAREKKEQKVLDQAEYFLEFLSWARKYLDSEFDIRVQEKKSIAKACADNMNKRARTARIQNYLAKQKAADKKKGSDITDPTFKRAMHFRESENFKQESDAMILDDDSSSNTTINLRQPSSELSTSEFGYTQAQINRSVA